MQKSGQLPCPSFNFTIRMHILSGSIVLKNFNNFRVQPASSYRQFTKFLEFWWDSKSHPVHICPGERRHSWIIFFQSSPGTLYIGTSFRGYLISRFWRDNISQSLISAILIQSNPVYWRPSFHNGHFFRGTQRLFSVKYLFGDGRKCCLEFYLAWGRLKISWWSFHSCKIFEVI